MIEIPVNVKNYKKDENDKNYVMNEKHDDKRISMTRKMTKT